ncbi:MAG: glutamate formimidoyltransferase [Spirochaetales bacterium]|nr:glutamate formimidoyltransferase [Spirochaetales bacterium]
MVSEMIECVPNISEGRNTEFIERIAEILRGTSGVSLLDVQQGYDTHRSVYTFVGSISAVEEAAFLLVKNAVAGIDMRIHRGSHPRIGAADVVPFIPFAPVMRDACIALSRRLAERVWKDLAVPVYLYGYAATSPRRVRLPDIRKGQYEELERKMALPEGHPDYGDRFNPKAGALVTGVRDFMLAYNVNLDTRDVEMARRIARKVRSSGSPSGTGRERVPGLLSFCQADGWFLPEYGFCQVTMNLHNPAVTGLHHAFEAVRKEAAILGLEVKGSELIGLAPLSAVAAAGRYYLGKEETDEATLVAEAVRSLGLNMPGFFDPEEKIIEYRLRRETQGLSAS